MMKLVSLALLLAFSADAFSPSSIRTSSTSTALNAEHPFASAKKVAASACIAATILSNVVALPAAAEASFVDDFGSTELVAARSGGRAGGRSSSARRSSAPARRSSSPTIIDRRTTVIQAAPAPSYGGGFGGGYAPPMYSPQPSGLGLAIGLNAVSGIASGMREARQEGEIRSTRDQLTEARIKEAEMEARLRQLEGNAQQSSNMQQMQMWQQQQQQQQQMQPAP